MRRKSWLYMREKLRRCSFGLPDEGSIAFMKMAQRENKGLNLGIVVAFCRSFLACF